MQCHRILYQVFATNHVIILALRLDDNRKIHFHASAQRGIAENHIVFWCKRGAESSDQV